MDKNIDLEPNLELFNIDEIYTISDFLDLCNKAVEASIPDCWLQGEISNFWQANSGHWYFSLKDDEGQIKCAMFHLSQRSAGFLPENGMQVLVHCSPSLYVARGEFQIVIKRIEAVGVGNLQLAFEQLKTKLKDEGLFAAKHKKSLPKSPQIIGVISSSNGAVVRDIIKVLNKRYPFSEVILFDCVVQGIGAGEKIATTIEIADKSKRCDVLIVARGGGSMEDLWAFNEEIVARAIFATLTPIISAIGHQTDVTIADFVADVTAPTPSAAAVIATPDRLKLLDDLAKLNTQIKHLAKSKISQNQDQLKSLKIPNPTQHINFLSQHLDVLKSQLKTETNNQISLNKSHLKTLFINLKQHSPLAKIEHKKLHNQLMKRQLFNSLKQIFDSNYQQFYFANKNLKKSTNLCVDMQKNRLNSAINSINHLSPLNTLARGYSITSDQQNQVLFDAKNLKIGDSISSQLSNGKIRSKIYDIKKN